MFKPPRNPDDEYLSISEMHGDKKTITHEIVAAETQRFKDRGGTITKLEQPKFIGLENIQARGYNHGRVTAKHEKVNED